MILRTLIILATVLSLTAGLAACGKKGPLDTPPPPGQKHKEKPAL